MSKETKISSFEAFTSLERRAIAFGAKAGGEVLSAIDVVTKAKEEWEGGSFLVMFALQDDMGTEEMNAAPRVGDDSSNNPAIIKAKVKSGDKTVTKTIDFWIVAADNTKRGVELNQHINWLNALGDPEADHNKVPAEFKATYTNPIARLQYTTILKAKRTVLRNSVRKAVSLYQQMQAINDLPFIECQPIFADEEQTTVIASTKPIRIWNPKKEKDEWDDFSIGSILKVDVAKAKELGGNLEAIKATLKRVTKGGSEGDTEKEGNANIETVGTFETFVSTLHVYIDDAVTDGKQVKMGELTRYLNGKTGDTLLANLVDIVDTLRNDVFPKISKLTERVAKVKEQQDAAEHITGSKAV